MHQQSSNLLYTERTSFESNFLKKYLPFHDKSIADSNISQEVSVLCTPENYMLVLNYSTSLEKENQSLRKELEVVKKSLESFQKKNKHLEQNMKKIQPLFFSNCSSQVKTEHSNHLAKNPSQRALAMTQRSNSHENIKKNNVKVLEQRPDFLDKEIIEELRKDNEQMASKIQQLFNEKQKLLDQSRKKRIKENNPKNQQNQPFDNINLKNVQQKKESITNKRTIHGKKHLSTSFEEIYQVEQANNFYMSQPCSFEISFQAPASLKSVPNLPQMTDSCWNRPFSQIN